MPRLSAAPRRATPRPLLAVFALVPLLALGCGDSSPTGPGQGVPIAVTTDRETALPGDTVTATITASPRDGAAVDYILVFVHGTIAGFDSIPFSAPGPQTVRRTVVVPGGSARGELAFTVSAAAGGKSGSAEHVVRVDDTISPTIASATRGINARGDTITVEIQASDNAGVAVGLVHFGGAFTATDTIPFYFRRSGSGSLRRAVPAGADFARPLTVAVEVRDAVGNVASTTLESLTLRDDAPPAQRSALVGWAGTPVQYAGEAAFAVGDNLTIELDASDNAALAWVGFRLGAPASLADSVAVGGAATYSATRQLTIPATWRGVSSVTFFARDVAGHLTESTAFPLSVYGEVARPTRVADLAGSVAAAVYDPKRHVAYLSQPDSDRVLVLSTATMQYEPPIAAPGRPMGLDLTPGGDTLLVALRGTTALGVVNLTAATRTLDTLHLEITNDAVTVRAPSSVRTTSRGTALVALTFNGSGYGGQLLELDLATGAQRVRTDAGPSGATSSDLQLTASGDRTKVALVDVWSCCGVPARIYDAATNSFGPEIGTIDTYGVHVSTDEHGDAFLIASGLYGPSLEHLRTFDPPGFDLAHGRVVGTTPTVMAPAGDVGYFAVADHYFALRLADGGVLEKVYLPSSSTRLLVVEGGAALLSLGATQAALVDLR